MLLSSGRHHVADTTAILRKGTTPKSYLYCGFLASNFLFVCCWYCLLRPPQSEASGYVDTDEDKYLVKHTELASEDKLSDYVLQMLTVPDSVIKTACSTDPHR